MSKLGTMLSARSRREQIIIAGGVVLLVIVVAVLLLSSGGGQPTDEGLGPILSPKASATPTPGTNVPVAGGNEGRDPFQPLIGPSPPPGGTPTPGATGGPGGPNPTGERRRVTLIDIFTQDGERMATVQVDDQEYTVAKGDTFAQNFQVVDISSRCATFLFGDERFSLCIGQEVLK